MLRFNVKLFLVCLSISGFYLEAKNIQNPPPPPAFDADLFKKDDQIFSVHTEFLFWRVEESSLDYALKMTRPSWGTSDSYAQGHFKTSTYSGEPGFRLKASFFRAPKYWEVWWQYTRLTARGKNHASKPGPDQQFLNGTWPQIFPATLASANTNLHLNYNVADMLVDRVFIPNPHLRLRLIGGIFTVWMNQDWKIHYKNSGSDLTKVRNRWRYIGGGIKAGTMTDWYWCYDIYLTGLVNTGLSLGSYRNRVEQTTNVALTQNDDPAVPVRDALYKDVRPAFTIQVIFGPSWQKNFTNTRIEVFAGYELNTWFNIQQVYRSTASSSQGSKETLINEGTIALQGLTTRLTVDF